MAWVGLIERSADVEGLVYYDNATDKLRLYNGTEGWVDISTSAAGGADNDWTQDTGVVYNTARIGLDATFVLSRLFFAGLGLGDPICISATNGNGVRQLIEEHVQPRLARIGRMLYVFYSK